MYIPILTVLLLLLLCKPMKDNNGNQQAICFPSIVGCMSINSLINHSQYTRAALAKHSVGFTRCNVPLDVMIKGAKWGRHSFDIRCCQPIRCPLITNGVRNGWWHVWYVHHHILFPTEGRRVFHLVQYAGRWTGVVSPSTTSAPPPRGSIPNYPKYKVLLHHRLEGLLHLICIVPNLQIIPGRSLAQILEMDPQHTYISSSTFICH